MLPDIKVVVGEDVCDESAREFEERRDNAVGLTVVPESEDVVTEPVLSVMMGIAVPPCVELDMRCSTVVVPTSRAVDWVGVEETIVAAFQWCSRNQLPRVRERKRWDWTRQGWGGEQPKVSPSPWARASWLRWSMGSAAVIEEAGIQSWAEERR